MFKKILQHKFITGIILLLIIAGGYFGYQRLDGDNNAVKYVMAAVEKGTLIVSVSGSGQVAVSDQLDIKPKVSGEVVYVGVENGQEVRTDTLIVQLDTKDAQKAVRDAEISLANAKNSLENLKNAKGKTEESLAATYRDGLNVLTNTFEDLSPQMSDLEIMFTESSYRGNENDIDYYIRLVRAYNKNSEPSSYWNEGAENKYFAVKKQFDAARTSYFMLTFDSPRDQIEIILNQTHDAVQTLLDLTRQAFNLIEKSRIIIETENLILPIRIETTNNQVSQLSGFVSSLVSRLNSLSSAKQSLEDKKEAVEKADSNIEDQIYVIEQREDALLDAKEKLNQCYIRAPFDGVIAKINVKKGDSVSSGTTLATLITKQKIAEISLNEIDAAKVKVGQKVTLTFDAVPDLSIAGEVTKIDAIGTVSQGVVSYAVKITFDTQDERVKPGMSVSSAIITDAKQDILFVPNSAVKSEGDMKYVEVMANDTPQHRSVETGLVNDTITEIVNGLQEDEQVVSQTITANTTVTTQNSNRNFRIPGL